MHMYYLATNLYLVFQINNQSSIIVEKNIRRLRRKLFMPRFNNIQILYRMNIVCALRIDEMHRWNFTANLL